jgi:hypothetical protein
VAVSLEARDLGRRPAAIGMTAIRKQAGNRRTTDFSRQTFQWFAGLGDHAILGCGVRRLDCGARVFAHSQLGKLRSTLGSRWANPVRPGVRPNADAMSRTQALILVPDIETGSSLTVENRLDLA